MPELNHNPIFVAVVIAVLGFMIGVAKGGFNALGALLTPILSLVLPVSLAVGALLPMLIVGDAFAGLPRTGKVDEFGPANRGEQDVADSQSEEERDDGCPCEGLDGDGDGEGRTDAHGFAAGKQRGAAHRAPAGEAAGRR